MNDAGPDGEPQSQLEKYVRTIIRYVMLLIDVVQQNIVQILAAQPSEHRENCPQRKLHVSAQTLKVLLSGDSGPMVITAFRP